ncbi:MAG: GTP-binding protein HSR1 [Richelia sp. RM1_1_1]|nr:GTP-binding protein HSR1 [Richelia sp. RM1_1_1]
MDNSNLRDNVKSIFELALSQTTNQPGLQNLHHTLQQSYERLHQPMRVAIVGLIKAGKSTLMNALLGEAVVAVGTVEATFNINWLKYDNLPSLVVHFKDGRSPEPKSFEQLKALTLRAKENQDYLKSIKYIEVGYPNEILKTFNLIDTPGLESFYKDDAQNTLEFLKVHGKELTETTQAEASNADAVMYLFSQTISFTDASIMQAFSGPALGHATPINAIGLLTKVDAYWSDYDNPMEAGEKIAKRLSEHPQIKSLFYTISPICGLLALGAQTLTPKEFEILQQLAKVPETVLESKLRVKERFTQREYTDIPVSPAQRKLVWDKLGQYGVWLACSYIRSGVNNLQNLNEELLEYSGVSQLRKLIISHFGHRAYLIKLGTALRQIKNTCSQQRHNLQGKERQIVEEIAGKFEELEANEHGFAEFKVLRDYYDKKLDFDENEVQQLLQVTGEYGTSCGQRLGLDEKATVEEMLAIALKQTHYWQQRAADYLGSDRTSIAAAGVLVRSYERILYRVQKAKEYLDF